MKLFDGVQEVRLFRPNGVVVTGLFDNMDAALRAVENEPSQYRAAYFTLNPVKLPAGIPINPASLNPNHGAAGASDIDRRITLLIDVDVPRPPGTNSTVEEKGAAWEQAERIVEWLTARGWPVPALCDSGNAFHILFRLVMPNDAASTELIKGFLKRLKESFPMVDSGVFDPPRLTKLYGSWVRKGAHSEERPHRRSAILSAGDDTPVTAEQIRALTPAPQSSPGMRVATAHPDDLKLGSLVGFLEHYSVVTRSDPREVSGGWQIEIECPWADAHSDTARRDTVVSFIAGIGYGFSCFHSHCRERHWAELRKEVERRNPGLTAYFGKLPRMTHSDIARTFIEAHDDFVRLYDQANATGVWLPGVRWTLSDPGDALLRKSIRRYLDELFERYPPPEKHSRDVRTVLKQAAFVSGVLAEVKPWLPPKPTRDFDADPTILPLPRGQVADLKRGIIREMRREDCQSKRLTVTPTDTPTPRWDRFLLEITCSRIELAKFIVRMFALAITGLSLHHLIFLFGRGRNGKGVSLRLLEKILGGEFAAVLKPSDLSLGGGENRDKRLAGRLRGLRMGYTGETVGKGLDWTLLKTLSGGDSLTGAKLYQDESGFLPTHTLFLLTNDRPQLQATAAFRGRLIFLEFDADFSDSKDATLENDLAQEIPGILWKLIKAAPGVFEHGIQPPPSVLEAGADVLDENDLGAPFIEQCLIGDAEAVTPAAEVEAAVKKYLGGGFMVDEAQFDQIMAAVQSRWPKKRRHIAGKQVRCFIGVRLHTS